MHGPWNALHVGMSNSVTRAPHNAICTTCVRPAAMPFRVYDERGKVTLGCVDAIHTGHLIGESLRWHNDLKAHQIRENAIAGRAFRTPRVLKRVPSKVATWSGTLDGKLIASAGDPAAPYAAEVF